MEIFELLLHFDEYLANIINIFGPLTYVILFLIVFAETGLVVTPFLPGDSLLFAVGALAGGNFLNIWTAYITLLAAAIIGDTLNYWIGNKLGAKAFARENSRIFKKEYLYKTEEFYKKHGGKAIILARFVPIVRTFAPFVAGVGKMEYRTFVLYNVVGAFLWVTSLTLAGYLFGQMPIIKNNFEYVVIAIVLISLLPMVFEYIKHKRGPKVVKSRDNNSYEDVEKLFKK